jgi:hypothetical protein
MARTKASTPPIEEVEVDLDKLVSQAKKVVDERGGVDSLAGDAKELKDIVGSHESLTDKAKDAAEALKTPGDHEPKAKPKPHG